MGRLLFAFIFVCLIQSNAFAGTPTPDGLDADIYSISINPETLTVGNYPEVMGYVQNKSSSTDKTGGNAVFDIKKVVTLPDKTKNAWFWDDVSFLPNEKKAYPLGKDYDISQPGQYLIEFSVYDSSRKNLISSLSKTFIVYADGLDADVYSISITPEVVSVGTYPEVSVHVQNKSAQTGKEGGKAVFDAKAVVTLPNKSKKAWWWDDVSFLQNQKKTYSLGNDYNISQPGQYSVEFLVYDSSRKYLISSLSKTFTVKEAVVKAPPPVPIIKETVEAPKTTVPTPPVSQIKPLTTPKTEALSLQPQKTAVSQPSETSARRYIGIGGFANTLNFSGGPTVILWPLKNLAIQGFYGWGRFESYEIRGLYRFDLSPMFKPYLGAGYLHAEREFELTSSSNKLVEGTIEDNSYTVFGGVEVSLIKDRLAFYVDVSGTPLKLEDDVTIGSDNVKVSMDYSPVTIGTGLVFYIW